MNFEKTDSQLYFESLVIPLRRLGNIKSRDIANISIANSQVQHLRYCLTNDSKHYFLKGIISLLSAFNSIEQKMYSWATIKIYYSVFYLLRCSLAINGIGVFRWQRDAFFLDYTQIQFQKLSGLYKSDHKAVIYLQKKYYSNSDKLLQSEIHGQVPYYWLMERRELVNYKHKTFEEPDILLFWRDIDSMLNIKSLDYLISLYTSNSSMFYCFDQDHTVLATPLQRLKLTCLNFKNSGISDYLEIDKLAFVKAKISDSELNKILDIITE